MAAVEMTHQFQRRRTCPTWDVCPTFLVRLYTLLDDGASKMLGGIRPVGHGGGRPHAAVLVALIFWVFVSTGFYLCMSKRCMAGNLQVQNSNLGRPSALQLINIDRLLSVSKDENSLQSTNSGSSQNAGKENNMTP